LALSKASVVSGIILVISKLIKAVAPPPLISHVTIVSFTAK
jgi:hypothetical protein